MVFAQRISQTQDPFQQNLKKKKDSYDFSLNLERYNFEKKKLLEAVNVYYKLTMIEMLHWKPSWKK